jgi:hypothetical protein
MILVDGAKAAGGATAAAGTGISLVNTAWQYVCIDTLVGVTTPRMLSYCWDTSWHGISSRQLFD